MRAPPSRGDVLRRDECGSAASGLSRLVLSSFDRKSDALASLSNWYYVPDIYPLGVAKPDPGLASLAPPLKGQACFIPWDPSLVQNEVGGLGEGGVLTETIHS